MVTRSILGQFGVITVTFAAILGLTKNSAAQTSQPFTLSKAAYLTARVATIYGKVGFAQTGSTVSEQAGIINLAIANPARVTGTVSVTTTCNSQVGSPDINVPATLPITATSPINLPVTINNDSVLEPNEVCTITLNNPVTGPVVLSGSTNYALTIQDNDKHSALTFSSLTGAQQTKTISNNMTWGIPGGSMNINFWQAYPNALSSSHLSADLVLNQQGVDIAMATIGQQGTAGVPGTVGACNLSPELCASLGSPVTFTQSMGSVGSGNGTWRQAGWDQFTEKAFGNNASAVCSETLNLQVKSAYGLGYSNGVTISSLPSAFVSQVAELNSQRLAQQIPALSPYIDNSSVLSGGAPILQAETNDFVFGNVPVVMPLANMNWQSTSANVCNSPSSNPNYGQWTSTNPANWFHSGNGQSEATAYKVAHPNSLIKLSSLSGANPVYVELCADMDFSIAPAGSLYSAPQQTNRYVTNLPANVRLNGRYFSINGIHVAVNTMGQTGIGFFGQQYGTLKNIHFNNPMITLSNSAQEVGIIAGYSTGITEKVFINNGTLSGQGVYMGGAYGWIDMSASVSDSTVSVNLNSTDLSVGSFAGYLGSYGSNPTLTRISAVTSTGATTGSNEVGGLIGVAETGTIHSSFAAAVVNANMSSAAFGRLVGTNYGGTGGVSYPSNDYFYDGSLGCQGGGGSSTCNTVPGSGKSKDMALYPNWISMLGEGFRALGSYATSCWRFIYMPAGTSS